MLNPVPLTVLLADSVVNAPAPAVPAPIDPGLENVAPFKLLAFKLATLVVLATVNGAVPDATVLVITPLALNVLTLEAFPPLATATQLIPSDHNSNVELALIVCVVADVKPGP